MLFTTPQAIKMDIYTEIKPTPFFLFSSKQFHLLFHFPLVQKLLCFSVDYFFFVVSGLLLLVGFSDKMSGDTANWLSTEVSY
jgi:hypothetical protein